MKLKQLMILALALGLPASALLAQDNSPSSDQQPPPQQGDGGPPEGMPPGGPGGPGGHRRPPMSPIIMALDTNHDGIISAEEIANAPAALKTLDKNGDGQLTKDELMPPRPPGGRQGGSPPAGGLTPPEGADAGGQGGHPPGGGPNGQHPVPPIMAALDLNGDGVLSADEIAAASTSLLKLDKNGDGQLTPDELRPPRPAPPGGDK